MNCPSCGSHRHKVTHTLDYAATAPDNSVVRYRTCARCSQRWTTAEICMANLGPPGHRICKPCGVMLPLFAFNKDRYQKDGRAAVCRTCLAERRAARRVTKGALPLETA